MQAERAKNCAKETRQKLTDYFLGSSNDELLKIESTSGGQASPLKSHSTDSTCVLEAYLNALRVPRTHLNSQQKSGTKSFRLRRRESEHTFFRVLNPVAIMPNLMFFGGTFDSLFTRTDFGTTGSV
jgi:hypothetical protein